MTMQDQAIDDRILRRPEVESMTGLGRSTLYELIAKNSFPPAVRLTSVSVGWRWSEVKRWIDSRPSVPQRQ